MLLKISNSIYYIPHSRETDRPNLGCICGENEALLVDAGNSPKHAKEFLEKLRETIQIPIQHVVITHWHWDHVFGLQELPFHIIGHEKTKNKLDEMRSLSWEDDALDYRVEVGEEITFCRDMMKKELPTRKHLQIGSIQETFHQDMTLNLGNQLIELHYVGGDHADDSIIVYIPQEKVLFLGDCLSPDYYSGDLSYSLSKLQPLVKKIKQFDCHTYITGHHKPETAEEFWPYFDKLMDVGLIVGNETLLEKAVEKYKTHYRQTPTRDQLASIEFFVNGNKKKGNLI